MEWEIREVEAWGNKEDGYEWNTSYHICGYVSNAKNERRAFVRQLNKRGIYFKRNRTVIVDSGDILEICDRATLEPLYAAIPRS